MITLQIILFEPTPSIYLFNIEQTKKSNKLPDIWLMLMDD